MNCPTCPDSTLVMSERSGVEIDYCPTCRGVWLDRGELDKIIERDAAPRSQPARSDDRRDDRDRLRSDNRDRYDRDDRDDVDDDDDQRYAGGGRTRRRRESLLSELFDF